MALIRSLAALIAWSSPPTIRSTAAPPTVWPLSEDGPPEGWSPPESGLVSAICSGAEAASETGAEPALGSSAPSRSMLPLISAPDISPMPGRSSEAATSPPSGVSVSASGSFCSGRPLSPASSGSSCSGRSLSPASSGCSSGCSSAGDCGSSSPSPSGAPSSGAEGSVAAGGCSAVLPVPEDGFAGPLL